MAFTTRDYVVGVFGTCVVSGPEARSAGL